MIRIMSMIRTLYCACQSSTNGMLRTCFVPRDVDSISGSAWRAVNVKNRDRRDLPIELLQKCMSFITTHKQHHIPFTGRELHYYSKRKRQRTSSCVESLAHLTCCRSHYRGFLLSPHHYSADVAQSSFSDTAVACCPRKREYPRRSQAKRQDHMLEYR